MQIVGKIENKKVQITNMNFGIVNIKESIVINYNGIHNIKVQNNIVNKGKVNIHVDNNQNVNNNEEVNNSQVNNLNDDNNKDKVDSNRHIINRDVNNRDVNNKGRDNIHEDNNRVLAVEERNYDRNDITVITGVVNILSVEGIRANEIHLRDVGPLRNNNVMNLVQDINNVI